MSDNDTTEQHPHFPSGEWKGFYLQQMTDQADQHPMAMILNFKNGKVDGSGSDEVGAFRWYGEYDVAQSTCRMIKQYDGRHAVAYDGRADDNGIYGTWYLSPSWKGGFHIWPKGITEKAEEEEVVTATMAIGAT